MSMGPSLPKQTMFSDTNIHGGPLIRAIGAAGEAFYCWDIDSDQLDWSPGAAGVLGMSDRGIPALASELQKQIAPDDLPARAIALSGLLDDGEAYACEFKIRRADGGFEWVEERGSVERDGDGKAKYFHGLMRVITAWKRREFELEQMAYFNDLTGHLNRTRLRESLDEVLANCSGDGSPAAYLLINIDRLGMLNDAERSTAKGSGLTASNGYRLF